MNQSKLRDAIKAVLIDDNDLKDLLSKPGAVFHRKAPAKAVAPYVIFQKTSGVSVWTFGESFRDMIWMVKGVCRDGDAEAAENIDERCEAILNEADLNLNSPMKQMYLARESDFDYDEIDKGDQVFHVGGNYRVVIDG